MVDEVDKTLFALDIPLFDGAPAGFSRAEPAVPASADEIAAAEQMLGRAYPTEYSALLTVANGFPDYSGSFVLLGTAGVGTEGVPGYPADFPASAWGCAREYIDVWYDVGSPRFSPDDPSECIPLTAEPNAGLGAAYVVATSGPGWREGTVVHISSDREALHDSIRAYLRSELEAARGEA